MLTGRLPFDGDVDQGSGTTDVLAEIVDYFMPESAANVWAASYRKDRIRTHEESVYHKLLYEAFSDPSPVFANVARWRSDRL